MILSLPPILIACAIALVAFSRSASAAGETMAGPLRVNPANPRYFTDDTGRAVYLTGSHTWANFKDSGPTDPPAAFDFNGYLDFLETHNHNFIRLWVLDQPKSVCDGFVVHFPWPRTGPGLANDGKPKFDLSQLDDSYFERLRSRVITARDRGFYVSLMLFEGYGLQFCRLPDDGHPFDGVNNINGINPASTSLTLNNPAALAIQKAYVRRVVDTVNDLDNVLYEVANEAGVATTAWQFEIINTLNDYQQSLPKQHPVGMTYQWQGGDNPTLFSSPADWISPGGVDPYGDNPPAANGTKVIISDTDHIYADSDVGDYKWVWRSFTRGLNTIYMDPLDNPPNRQGVRRAMGHTREYSERLDLVNTLPSGNLTSTTYCLAKQGMEYLVYQPANGSFTVNLSSTTATFGVEWFNPATGTASLAANVTGGGVQSFTPPFAGPAVLYLRNTTLPVEPSVTVNLTSPANGAAFLTPLQSITLTATASDRYGTINKVEFYDGGTLLGTVTSPPFTFAWTNPPVGTRTLTAHATNNLAATEISEPVVIAVGAKPEVALFTVTDGVVSFLLLGNPGCRFRVDVSTDLSDWSTLQYATVMGLNGFTIGAAIVVDPQSVNHPKRFYRASLTP